MTKPVSRIGLVGVVFGAADHALEGIENVLASFPDVIIARMSVPRCAPDSGLLTLVVNATTDQIGALAGRLGMIEAVRVKSIVL